MENTDEVAAAVQDPSTIAESSKILETGSASSNPLQEGLPSVAILEIFEHLDLHSLLRCRLVCSGFQYLVDSTASLQYKIELAVAGQQDGSHGDMFARREMLKMHQKRWDGLQWTEVLRVPMIPNFWALQVYGGVFAQANSEIHTLHLKRIPSQSRGIKEKTWILDLSILCEEEARMRDFGMDPSQDLLVIIASAGSSLRIHLLTLSKGERHPLTSESYLVLHDWDSSVEPRWTYSFYIDICHDFLSIHSVGDAVVWNWKTGQLLMHIVNHDITSVVFLNERYVLMTIMRKTYPYLLAVDFLAEPSEQRGLDELENTFSFRFPNIPNISLVNEITVRSNPRSTWEADTDPSIPFSMVPQNRLFVVYFHATRIHNDFSFAILEASFLSLIKTGLRVNNNSFNWSMWGPEHSRALPSYIFFPMWPEPLHGTRLAMKRNIPHRDIVVLDLYDFNQLGCRNKKQGNDAETPGNVNVSESSEIIEGQQVCVLGPTRIKAKIFGDEVDTSLAYSVTSWSVPGKSSMYASAICSEDAVIIVDEYKKLYEIYTV